MEMQVRTILRSHRTLGEMEKINKAISNKCWMTCEEKRDPQFFIGRIATREISMEIFQKTGSKSTV